MIRLHHIQPVPLRGLFSSSEIWNADCQFFKGKYYLITAPSGKGKSTFLHIIYGLRHDFEGDLIIDDQFSKSIDAPSWSVLRAQKLAIVFQDLRLFLDLSGIENILVKNKLTDHKTESEINNMIEKLGISAVIRQPVNALSYGQRQRVALIRALCQPFEFLLLDEPFSHLDEDNAKTARNLVLEECEKQKAGLILASLGEDYGINFNKNLTL
ncbi:MAG: ATP-binding cassette domain-containing protein [Bacteroidota bacterium]